MKISVVIPTHNRSRGVVETVMSLVAQTRAPTEIIVVDNASSDDTEEVVARLKQTVRRLRYIYEPRLGVSAARNRGATESRSSLIAFLDDDAVASGDWLARLHDTMEQSPWIAAASGPIELRWTRPAPPWVRGLEGWYGRFDLGPDPKAIEYPLFPYASNLMFRREAFLSIGGFPIELGPRGKLRIANEEDGLFRRFAERKWLVMYEPRALVHHWVHLDRLSRRYLLNRGVTQGKSEVLVDALLGADRRRTERLGRGIRSAQNAWSAALVALDDRSPDHRMRALMTSAVGVGAALGEARFAFRPRPHRSTGETRQPGLTEEQRLSFQRDGFVRIPGAFDGAAQMEEAIWRFFARRGVDRHDRSTWPSGEARHLQKLLTEPAFMGIGGNRTTAAIDALMGAQWIRPDHWGELLVTFPDRDRPWTVPTLWHTDARYDDPLEPPGGLVVFSFINSVEHRGGGTLVLAGSHRLIARHFASDRGVGERATAAMRREFYQSHPWLEELVTAGPDPHRWTHLSAEVLIDGLPARMVELTGEPGEIVLVHPLLAHCIAVNGGTQPRFMRVVRPRSILAAP